MQNSFFQGGFLSSLAGLGFMIALMNTPDDGKNTKTRLGYLLSFAFLSGNEFRMLKIKNKNNILVCK